MNPFEFFGHFEKFKALAEDAMRDIDASWLGRAGLALVVKFVLESAKREGPPPGFAERLHMEPDQAKILYNATLDAALSRK